MPKGLRRSEPQQPPVGSTIGSTTILPPVEVDRTDAQVLHGTSNPFMDKASAAYKDMASPAKPSKPPPHPHGPPFDLTR